MDTTPATALELIERYFDEGGDLAEAWAHEIRARAHIVQGDIEAAIAAYEAALERERTFPNVMSHADIELAMLFADRRLSDRYSRALELLEKRRVDKIRWLVFPNEIYCWAGSLALILAEGGAIGEAQALAESALTAASAARADFRHHPQVGLVPSTDTPFRARLRALAEGR